MNWMYKLEQKWGRYAIYNLHKYLAGAYAIGLILSMFLDINSYLSFSVELILQGQIWRLVTWVFCADGGSLLSLLFVYCVFNIGRSFEQMVGTFRMNVYLIGGMLLNIIGGILVYVVTFFIFGQGQDIYLTNYYVLFSIFLALALCMPEGTVYFSFLFPMKMKWMFLIYIVGLVYELYSYFNFGNQYYGAAYGFLFMFVYGAQIIFSLLNLFLFFHFSKIRLSRKQKKRQREFQAQMRQPRRAENMPRHKCAICGRTEKDSPDLVFRFCSKCTGNKEYCQEHLFTHTHN